MQDIGVGKVMHGVIGDVNTLAIERRGCLRIGG